MSSWTKPHHLQPGDTVAVLSPSSGVPSLFPHVFEAGLDVLRGWGLTIKEYPSARADIQYLRENPQVRAEDLNAAFADPEVAGIITSIGGNDSARILRYLDAETLTRNPKILMGFSDTSTLHTYLAQLGITSLYGPSVMAGLAQTPRLPTAFEEHMRTMLFDPQDKYVYEAYGQYTDGYGDWAQHDDGSVIDGLKEDQGWRWLQGETPVDGRLFGGCIEVLEMLKGTPYWPEPSFWDGKILFLETSEEKPSLNVIDHMLRNYGVMGVFDRINAFIVSRARDYTDDEKAQLDEKIIEVVASEFGRRDLPIVTNFDIGHTVPQLVMPIGVRARVDPHRREVKLTEQWLS